VRGAEPGIIYAFPGDQSQERAQMCVKLPGVQVFYILLGLPAPRSIMDSLKTLLYGSTYIAGIPQAAG
jgi:hypothetical protein